MKYVACFLSAMLVAGTAVAQDFTTAPDYRVALSTGSMSRITGPTVREAFMSIETLLSGVDAGIAAALARAQDAYDIATTSLLTVASTLTLGELYITNNIVVSNGNALVSYMGYPRLNNGALTEFTSGTTVSTTSRKLGVDTNLATHFSVTFTPGATKAATYFMDLGTNYDGVVVVYASGDLAATDADTFSALANVVAARAAPASSTVTPGLLISASHGIGMATAGGWGHPLGSGIQSMVLPFSGRYVGVQFINRKDKQHTFRVYEIIAYGVPSVWTGFPGGS